MSWFRLMAELGVDINPFRKGLSDAHRAAGQAGDKIGKDLKNKLWGAFGAGAVVGGFTKMFGDAKEITQQAFLLRRSTDEVQAMQHAANKTGLSFGEISSIMDGTAQDVLPHVRERVLELIAEFGNLGLAIDENMIKKMDEAAASSDRAFDKLKKYAGEAIGGTINFVEKMSQLLGAYSVSNNGMSLTEFLTSGAAADALKNPNKPAALKEKAEPNRLHDVTPEKMEKVRDIGMLQADNYARIGGFVGNAGTSNPIVDIARQQLQVQKRIEANTKTGNFGADKFSGGG